MRTESAIRGGILGMILVAGIPMMLAGRRRCASGKEAAKTTVEATSTAGGAAAANSLEQAFKQPPDSANHACGGTG